MLHISFHHIPEHKVINLVAYDGVYGVRLMVSSIVRKEQVKAFRDFASHIEHDSAKSCAKAFDKIIDEFAFILDPISAWNGSPASIAHALPGVQKIVKHPITNDDTSIYSGIINLNDVHRWSREEIAQWLETLDVDIRFKVVDDGPKAEPIRFSSWLDND